MYIGAITATIIFFTMMLAIGGLLAWMMFSEIYEDYRKYGWKWAAYDLFTMFIMAASIGATMLSIGAAIAGHIWALLLVPICPLLGIWLADKICPEYHTQDQKGLLYKKGKEWKLMTL